MVYYLQMDGVDDRLKSASVTINKADIEIYLDGTDTQYIFDGRTNFSVPANLYFSGGGKGAQITTIYENDTTLITAITSLTTNQKIKVTFNYNQSYTAPVNILSAFGNFADAFTKGRIYTVKLYNDSTLVANYDMSTQTVLDQSGNGNHAILTGGTWVDGGINGSISYTIKNQIYSTNLFNFDSKQSLYQTLSQLYDNRIEQYRTDLVNLDSKQSIYNNLLSKFNIKNEIYQTSLATYTTNQIINQTANILYDTLQQIFDAKLTGSTKFDTLLALYESSAKFYDTKQIISKLNTTEFPLKQAIYNSSGTDYNTLQQLLTDFKEYQQVIEYIMQMSTCNEYSINLSSSHINYNVKI